MNIGMLWFDNDPKSDLKAKIERAVVYYRSKYGKTPNTCIVNPSMLESGVKVPNLEIKANKQVMPNHLWIGVSR